MRCVYQKIAANCLLLMLGVVHYGVSHIETFDWTMSWLAVLLISARFTIIFCLHRQTNSSHCSFGEVSSKLS